MPQSYRVPKHVQSIAHKILERIPDERRIRKHWKAREEEGFVDHITSIEDVPLSEGDWLILARTNDRLNKIKPILKDMGKIWMLSWYKTKIQ